MTDRSLGRTIWNLVLALLNATLILLAICLWFAWGAMSSAERVATEIRTTVTSVQPVREEFRGLRGDIQDLRADLASLQNQDGTRTQAVAELSGSINSLQGEIESLSGSIRAIDVDPNAVVTHAIETTFQEIGELVARLVPRIGTGSE